MAPKKRTAAVTAPASPPPSKRPKPYLARPQVPLDEGCPLGGHRVHIDGDGVAYDAALNQTNAGNNNNKFYRSQLLENAAGECRTWTRWGRVGEHGQSKLLGEPGDPLTVALQDFNKKFKDKSGLPWANRLDAPKSNKYVYLERSYEPDPVEEPQTTAGAVSKSHSRSSSPPKCTLDPAVRLLMELIFNQQYFAAAMQSFNYDAEKLPLGKLGKSTITRGFQTLKDLSEALENSTDRETIESLSNLYYSLIPHSFGRDRPPVIATKELLQKEVELLESLSELKDADNILKAEDDGVDQIHQLDFQFSSLGLNEMTPLSAQSSEFGEVATYLVNTRGSTHAFKYEIESIFRVERRGEDERLNKGQYAKVKSDRRLLWHGSRTTNWAGILSQGLRIAPPEAPVSGYMFDKGIYLADMSSKSANYCYADLSGGCALLTLCEAELGDPMQVLQNADYRAGEKAKEKGMISTWGQGATGPLRWKDAECVHPSLKGVKMPDVKTTMPGKTGISPYGLMYNEYIAYDVAQVRLRYLLRVRMTHDYDY